MATMTIRVDEQLKQDFDSLCDRLGLTNSAALTLYMKAVVRERRIPFAITAESDAEVRERWWKTFLKMREKAIESGAADMTLDEINEEISAARNGQ